MFNKVFEVICHEHNNLPQTISKSRKLKTTTTEDQNFEVTV